MKRITLLLSVVVLTTGCGHMRASKLANENEAMRTINGELISEKASLEYSLQQASADAQSCREKAMEAAKAEAAEAEAAASVQESTVITADDYTAFQTCLGQLKEGANPNGLTVTRTGNQTTCQYGP